ncbi:MAG: SRPBCC family protein [Microthrixaceae bacterium]
MTVTRRPADWIDHAPLQIVAARLLAVPADAVWDRIVDHATWPEWFTGVRRITPGSPAEGVGGTRRVELTGVTIDEEFTEWEPRRRFAFTVVATSRPFVRSLNERVDIEEIDESSSRVTYTQGWDPLPAVGVGLRLLRRPVTRRVGRALERLGALAG